MVRSGYWGDQEAGSCRSLGGMRHRPVAEPESRQKFGKYLGGRADGPR